MKNREKEELKEMAHTLGKISQSSEFFLKRNKEVTKSDREHISTKNLQLYNFAYRLLEYAGATEEELKRFLDDYEERGKVI